MPTRILTTILILFFFSINLFANSVSESSSFQNIRQTIESENKAKELGRQWNNDSINKSIALYSAVFNFWKKTREFEKATDCLREISIFYLMMGENENAVALLLKAHQLDTKHKNSYKKVKTLSQLSTALLRLGKIDDARKYSDKAFFISRTANSFAATATALSTRAQLDYDEGQFNLAAENYEKALESWKKTDELREQAITMLDLSYSDMTNDELLAGLENANESLAIFDKINDQKNKVLAQVAVGVLQSKLGNKQNALNILLQCEKQFPDQLNLLEKGSMYNHLAEVYFDFNDLNSAVKYHLKALEIFQNLKHSVAQLATLSKLGITLYKLNDKKKGLEYFETGFKLARKVKNDYFYSVFAQDLGNLLLNDNPAKALSYFKVAQPIFDRLNIRTHLALNQSSIGSIYFLQGKNETARKYFDEALKLNRETKNSFAESQNLFNIALVENNEGNYEKSLESIKQSLEITESFSLEVLNSKLKTAFFSNIVARYEFYINLLAKLHRKFPDRDYHIEALQAAEKSRARSILEKLSLSAANFNKDADPNEVKRETEIRNLLSIKSDKLTDALSGAKDEAVIEKISSDINELTDELEQIKADFKQSSPIYSAIKNPPPFDLIGFQNKVFDPNTLLLEFSFGTNESCLWLVGKNFVELYVLPPRAEIEGKIENLRKLIDSRQILNGETIENYQARISLSEVEFQQQSQVFSNELLGQIADKLRNQRLIIVPDGKLHYFPIGVLPFPNSAENQPLLLSNEIIYEPSASTLELLLQTKQKTAAPKNVIVFSDPIFSVNDSRFSNSHEEKKDEIGSTQADKFRFAESLTGLSRLPASQEEADSLIEIVGASGSTVFSGASATREQVLDSSTADYKILHFATHGLIDETRPELSGIVLSQIDDHGQNQNGVVRLQDIYSMNLSADLVVLSACSTGIGKEVKGEGLMSLDNAFLQTGAKTVVSSLWKVDDEATRELMKIFYREMIEGKPTSEALRRAQIKLRENPQYQSPFYWAAFTAQGDFQNVPQVSGSLHWRIYALLILPFALIGAYAFRRRLKSLNRKIVSKI